MTDPVVMGLQMDLAWEDGKENRARAERLLERHRPEAGGWVVLPEMFASGFSMAADRVAEAPGGETECWVQAMARTYGVHVVAGWALRDPERGPMNVAGVLGPDGRMLGQYRKRRLFRLGGEDGSYVAGNEPLVVEAGGLRVSVLICYDLRFPELFREAAREGVDLFVVVANWPGKRIGHWDALLRARAIENQAYVLGVNRVGTDPAHEYPGHSQLVNPWGDVVAQVGEGEKEGVVSGGLDVGGMRLYREKLPFLADLD
jgi:predicted amidohydrolase